MSTNHIQSPFPLIHVDLNRDPNPSHDFFFPNCYDHLSSPSGRILFPQQPHPHHQEHHPHHANFVDELIIAQGGPYDHPPSDVTEGDRDLYHEHGHDHHHHHKYCSVKWMSSKMRIMKKMTGSGGKPLAGQKFEHDPKHEAVPQIILENDSNRSFEQDPKHEAVPPIILENDSSRSSSSGIESNNNSIIIRVCSDCNTTKTPLWRSGPQGPKSLCNACGIRQRKARRAMALAAAAANGEPLPYPIPDPIQKAPKLQEHKKKKKKENKKRLSSSDNKDDDESDQNPKKKFKHKGTIVVHPPADPRKLCFEEFMLRLSERISCFQGVFPQDEKEAAILLMALSYGFVQS